MSYSMAVPKHLSGTTLEGGGQLLRIAVGVSALTDVPLRITDIRGNRPGGGGLKTQHLAAVKWLESASCASVEGAEKKSRVLDFRPGQNVLTNLPKLGTDVLTHDRALD
jgi:RNA 3'-terminal phosphate cyclase (ATP)